MNALKFLAIAATALCITTAAHAQSDTTDEPAETPEAEAPTDAQAQPTESVKSVHDDWQLRCRGETDCFLYQLVSDVRDAPVAEVNVVALKREDGAVAGVTIISPLRTLLTQGLTLQIDNDKLQKYPFIFCAPGGCAARFGYKDGGLSEWKRGNRARVTIVSVDRPDAPVVLDVSLKGFTAGFDALAAASN